MLAISREKNNKYWQISEISEYEEERIIIVTMIDYIAPTQMNYYKMNYKKMDAHWLYSKTSLPFRFVVLFLKKKREFRSRRLI